ncbi:NADH dehydrogenase (quinone) subunit D [Candidatus Sumerlaeota bacterium]|nr:NADH dehydrogenase (quinone) subunit D [Candidatus Sumerlaeota bacterium]
MSMTSDNIGEEAQGRRTVDYSYDGPETMKLNMGPVHPSTHGVLRLVLELDGETVAECKPVIGYLHSGKEKLAEAKTYHQFIPYTDRLDYLAPMSNNTAYALTVEKILGVEVTERCKWLRVMLCELARIASHLLGIGAMALDLGATTPFLWAFTEREKLYDLFEIISGARFTVSYMRVGGVARDATDEWLAGVKKFVDEFPAHHKDIDTILTKNEIFLRRTKDIGFLSVEDGLQLGISGPSLRGSGIDWDIRRSNPYLVYDQIDFNVVTRKAGDVYARYLCRMDEMLESLKIVQQCLDKLPNGPVNIDNYKVIYPPRDRVKESMEALIHHFLLAQEGITVPEGEAYVPIEGPKGEMGFYVVSDGTTKPLRNRIRTPSFYNLWAIPHVSKGALLADLVAIIGSFDIVLGEIDR